MAHDCQNVLQVEIWEVICNVYILHTLFWQPGAFQVIKCVGNLIWVKIWLFFEALGGLLGNIGEQSIRKTKQVRENVVEKFKGLLDYWKIP